MNEIRAFVGHSFTDDDKDVVGALLRYLGQLSRSHPSFSWQNAETAEPKDLAEKVMERLADKNVFIGICTKKERALRQQSLKRAWFRPRSFLVEEQSFDWKTSDWIIQEIGLAIGRKLHVILLVENGVRTPGGLQGNMEYIPLDREAPEKSFGKLLEMLAAFSPSAPSPTALVDAQMLTVERKEPAAPTNDVWKKPQSDWTRGQFEFAFMHMVVMEDFEGVERINKAYLENQEAARADNAQSWQAFTEYTKLTFGKSGSFSRLKDLAERFPDSSGTLEYIARGYGEYKDRASAAATYETAAAKALTDREALRLLRYAAEEFSHAGMSSSAFRIISEMKTRVGRTGDGEYWLLDAPRTISDIAKENDVALAALERVVELNPANTDARFDLAYRHSQSGNNDLALFHYLKVPEQQRHSVTWNNLGVAFDQFSMHGKSVAAYRKAEDMGNTLAMSNLGNKFLAGGFLSEAHEACDKALQIKDYHQNVAHTLAKAKELPEEEDQKETELLAKARPKSLFYARLGRAASESEPAEIAEHWEGPDCELTVSMSAGVLKAVGSFERRRAGGLLALAMLTGSDAAGERMVRFSVEYSGVLRGRAVEGHVTRVRNDDSTRSATVLGEPLPKKVLMFLSSDGMKFRAMENPDATDPTFYDLKRKPDSISMIEIKLNQLRAIQAPAL